MSMATVKAVGFAYSSPEVILLFADHDSQQLHVYPSKESGDSPKFSRDGRKNVLLLLSLDALPKLASWNTKLHRVLIFGTADDLFSMNLPVLDALREEDGKVTPNRRQTRDELLTRIEDEAISVPLDRSVSAQRHASRKAAETASYSGPTFREILKELRSLLSANVPPEFTFADDVGVPSIMRLMHETQQTDFKGACKRMIEVGGLPENKVKALFRWVEGIDGIGPELSKAVDAFIYPDEAAEEITADAAASKYGVDQDDVKAVAKVYRRLQDIEEE